MDRKCKGCIHKGYIDGDENKTFGYCTNKNIHKKLNIPLNKKPSCFYVMSYISKCEFKEESNREWK